MVSRSARFESDETKATETSLARTASCTKKWRRATCFRCRAAIGFSATACAGVVAEDRGGGLRAQIELVEEDPEPDDVARRGGERDELGLSRALLPASDTSRISA